MNCEIVCRICWLVIAVRLFKLIPKTDLIFETNFFLIFFLKKALSKKVKALTVAFFFLMFWSSSHLLLHSSMMQSMLLIGKWEKNGTSVTIQPLLWPSADQLLSSVSNALTLQWWWPISRPRKAPPVQMGKPHVTSWTERLAGTRLLERSIARQNSQWECYNCVPAAFSDDPRYCREGDQREKDGKNNSTLSPTAFRSYSRKLHPTRVQLAHIMKRSDVFSPPLQCLRSTVSSLHDKNCF